MPARIRRREGRTLFGRDPCAYEAGRPDYPERVTELLTERCGLADGCRTLEVGAGPGRLTRRLLERGARPLVAVEPDPGFAAALHALAASSHGRLVLMSTSFEAADLDEGAYDLAVCASSFHWLDRARGPRKLGACLAPGGWLAVFWNVFGDPTRRDPFHEATLPLLDALAASPSHPPESDVPFALDVEARREDFRAARADGDFALEEIRWTLRQDPGQVRALYATFSPIARLPQSEREALLDRIAAVAADRFGGRVERSMVTPVYTGRRRR